MPRVSCQSPILTTLRTLPAASEASLAVFIEGTMRIQPYYLLGQGLYVPYKASEQHHRLPRRLTAIEPLLAGVEGSQWQGIPCCANPLAYQSYLDRIGKPYFYRFAYVTNTYPFILRHNYAKFMAAINATGWSYYKSLRFDTRDVFTNSFDGGNERCWSK